MPTPMRFPLLEGRPETAKLIQVSGRLAKSQSPARGRPHAPGQLDQERRVIGRLRPLAEVAVDPARPQSRRQAGGDQREVDAKAQAAVEVALAVVPPGEPGRVGLEVPVGVHEARRHHPGERRALLRRDVRRADERRRVVDVGVGGARRSCHPRSSPGRPRPAPPRAPPSRRETRAWPRTWVSPPRGRWARRRWQGGSRRRWPRSSAPRPHRARPGARCGRPRTPSSARATTATPAQRPPL